MNFQTKQHEARRSAANLMALLAALAFAFTVAACSSGGDEITTETTNEATGDSPTETTNETTGDSSTGESESGAAEPGTSTFTVEVWADNWMAVYVDGELIGQDAVSITTERSFNAEAFTFEASYPFTIGIEAKDFMETSSGIEYIGENNQQMGDGGLIAQITDDATSEVVAATDGSWSTLVTQRAPLNPDCERDADPDATCEFEQIDTPDGWSTPNFDDSGWDNATEWSAAAVDPKDGYDEISWDPSAQLIWGSDLEIDNTILFRTTVIGS